MSRFTSPAWRASHPVQFRASAALGSGAVSLACSGLAFATYRFARAVDAFTLTPLGTDVPDHAPAVIQHMALMRALHAGLIDIFVGVVAFGFIAAFATFAVAFAVFTLGELTILAGEVAR